MNDSVKMKIRGFLSDTELSDAVKEVFRQTFFKHPQWEFAKDLNVEVLAASRLALDFLDEGFKELEKIAIVEADKSVNEKVNPGL